MSGIPVYTSSPINAAKASGTTPQTALPYSNPASVPATAITTSSSSYAAAQPGAFAFPAPTGTAQRYAPPLQPTPTTKTDQGLPAAPQSGAAPVPTSRNVLPPPPKAGQTYQPATPSQYPPQMNIPPPTSTYRGIPPSSTTSTSTTASMAYPIGLSSAEAAPRGSLEHPPGYHQDIHASELTNEQMRMREANESAQDTGEGAGVGAEGVWDRAKQWATTAGEKIQSAEAEVWRKVGKE